MNLYETFGKFVNNEQNIQKTASFIGKSFKKSSKIAGGIIGTGIVLDALNRGKEKADIKAEQKMMERERKRNRKKEKGKDLAYSSMEEFNGFMQELWEDRNKHSRKWGGKIY